MSGDSISIGLGTGIDGGGCADESPWGTAFGIRCPVGLLAELVQLLGVMLLAGEDVSEQALLE
jgi:hypothetical protein